MEVKHDSGSEGVYKIVVETDEENPVTVAEITAESVDPAEGYRIRLIPRFD